ncbi:MAG: hypothetical protein ACRDZM_09160 [Acidimicrobiia bacterium]
METHQPDLTSDGATEPWDNLSSELSHIGDRLKDAYHQAASDGGPTDEEIRDAFATLAAAWDRLAASFSAALGDPRARAHLKNAAGSLVTALKAIVSDLGDGLDVEGGDGPNDEGGVELRPRRRDGPPGH